MSNIYFWKLSHDYNDIVFMTKALRTITLGIKSLLLVTVS